MHDWIGKYAIVRSSPSGVWAGTIASIAGTTVELTNARRLWRWWSAEGVSLSGVAAKGLHPDKLNECRIAVAVERVIVNEVCEVLSASYDAQSSIEAQKAMTS